MRTSLIVADAQRLVRESLRAVVESRTDLTVVAEADDGREFVALCQEHEPDLAVVDAQLTGVSGLEALRAIRSQAARPRCVITAASDDPGIVGTALLAGASAFVPKSASIEELLAAIEAARIGRPFFARCVHGSLADALGEAGCQDERAGLTERQVEVLRLVADGLSTKEIASELGVSMKTAQTHRINLMKKVGAHKATELVRYAIREGIVEA